MQEGGLSGPPRPPRRKFARLEHGTGREGGEPDKPGGSEIDKRGLDAL